MTTKFQRQRAIVALVSEVEISSQTELRERLAADSITATQATISRDLEELGIAKLRGVSGRLAYTMPSADPERPAPAGQLQRVLGEWVSDVVASGTLVVVRTPPGCAHVVASALDRSAMRELLGTVAGDDTVLCVAAERIGGTALAAKLRELAGLGVPRPSRGARSSVAADRGKKKSHAR
jgi:transcriptional regulator of arginine metabolism